MALTVNYMGTTLQKFIDGQAAIPNGTLITLLDTPGMYYKLPAPGNESGEIRRIAREQLVDSLDSIKVTANDDGTLYFAKDGKIGLAGKRTENGPVEMILIADRFASPTTPYNNYRRGTEWVPATTCIVVAKSIQKFVTGNLTVTVSADDFVAINGYQRKFYLFIHGDFPSVANDEHTAWITGITIRDEASTKTLSISLESAALVASEIEAQLTVAVDLDQKNSGAVVSSRSQTISGVYNNISDGYLGAIFRNKLVEIPPVFPYTLEAYLDVYDNGTNKAIVTLSDPIDAPTSRGEYFIRCTPRSVATNVTIRNLEVVFRNRTSQHGFRGNTITSADIANVSSVFKFDDSGAALIRTYGLSESQQLDVKRSIATELGTDLVYGLKNEDGELKFENLGAILEFPVVEAITAGGSRNARSLKVEMMAQSKRLAGAGKFILHINVSQEFYLDPWEVSTIEICPTGSANFAYMIQMDEVAAITPTDFQLRNIYILTDTAGRHYSTQMLENSASAGGTSNILLSHGPTFLNNNITLQYASLPIQMMPKQVYNFTVTEPMDIDIEEPILINGYPAYHANTHQRIYGLDMMSTGIYQVWLDENEEIQVANLADYYSGALHIKLTGVRCASALAGVQSIIEQYDQIKFFGAIDEGIFVPEIYVPENRTMILDFTELKLTDNGKNLLTRSGRDPGYAVTLHIPANSQVRIVGFDTEVSARVAGIYADGLGCLYLDKCVQGHHGDAYAVLVYANTGGLEVHSSRILGSSSNDPEDIGCAIIFQNNSQKSGLVLIGCQLGDASHSGLTIANDVHTVIGNVIFSSTTVPTQITPELSAEYFSFGNSLV